MNAQSRALQEELKQVLELIDAATELVMGSTPFVSALELGKPDGEDLHERMRTILGISEEEWRESSTR